MTKTKNNLLDPREWLAQKLAEKRLTTDDLMKKADISRSSVTRFRQGIATQQLCIKIAQALNEDPMHVLAVGLHFNMKGWQQEADELRITYLGLGDADRANLLSYARWLASKPQPSEE